MFLTREDPNAVIKGSRDPLGLQVIWYHFGRNLISNLTTQTNDARGFTVLLLGRFLAEKYVHENSAVDIFLRVEQICAYVRHIAFAESGIRGILRVRRNSLKPQQLPISSSPESTIMSNQQAYGLWGMYSVAARVSGLIPSENVGIEDTARQFVEQVYWPKLSSKEAQIRNLVLNEGHLNAKKPDDVFEVFKLCLDPSFNKVEREFYTKNLRNCACQDNNTQSSSIQTELADLMLKHWKPQQHITRRDVEKLKVNSSSALDEQLDKVMRLEAVLGLISRIFDQVLSRDGDKVENHADSFESAWNTNIPHIRPDENIDLSTEMRNSNVTDGEIIQFFEDCQRELVDANYEQVIKILISWASNIAGKRGGSPWVTLGSDGKIQVRYRRQEFQLPSTQNLQNFWLHSYFFSSLNSITHELGAGN